MNLTVSTRRAAGEAVVAVTGEIDLASGGQVDREIVEAIDGEGTVSVVVDLSEVRFMDSSGIAVLIRGRRRADEHGVSYRITGANGMVRQVLELTGILAHLSGENA
ncbi:MAG TPA: STAS domain-containing protein [Micromonosporaceae bacterium]|nr:STAS domain-containing protein [Micromonosporaceae bacterium]